MIWLTWRQFRAQAAVALGALVAVAIALAVTSPHIVHSYDAAVAACKANSGCPAAKSAFLRYDLLLQEGLNALVIFVPGLIGMFWGAPLVARELETGTYRLAWTEGVTRRCWLAVKLGDVGLASMAAAGLLSLMVTWWASPIDRVNVNRLSPGVFAARGVVPVSYAAFAFTAGVTAGLTIRRTVPAMAATLAAFFGARLAMTYWVRPYFATPLTLSRNYWTFRPKGGNVILSYPMSLPAPPGAWEISDNTVNASGHVAASIGCLPSSGIHVGKGSPRPSPAALQAANRAFQNALHACLVQYRQVLSYQPASRYWPFQWYETAIFLGVALVLGGFCIWWVRRPS